MKTITVNGRSYAWPQAPTVVVCIDGSEPDYIEIAVAGARGGGGRRYDDAIQSRAARAPRPAAPAVGGGGVGLLREAAAARPTLRRVPPRRGVR